MKYLGLDYGEKRVGIAVSDEEATIAFPRIAALNDEKLFPLIAEIIRKEKIGKIIIGDTRSSGGLPNPITKHVEDFADVLHAYTAIPVSFVPEIWSSVEAARFSQDTKRNDASAAAIILQRYLDGLR